MSPRHVVLLICDQMQYGRQGRVDPIAHTPNLDRFADEGVFFSHCFASHGQCVPSRASIQTGLFPHEAGVMTIYGIGGHTAHLTSEHRTVGRAFREAGYETAYLGKMHFGVPVEDLGYDRGGGVVEGPKPGRRGDLEILSAARDLVSRHDPRRPLFLTVSLHMPHRPFELVRRFKRRYPIRKLSPPGTFDADLSAKPRHFREHASDPRFRYRSVGDLLLELRQYYTMISEVDRLFGELRAALEARGIWEEAVVVFTSDHGDMMGSFGVDRKGPIPYDPVYRIPLIARLPGASVARRTIPDLVSNVSLPGTLLDAAGLPVPPEFRGGSLLPVVARTAPPEEEEEVFFEHYSSRWGVHPFRAVRTRDWKYVRYYGPDDTEELVHLASDPDEVGNLAGDAAAEPIRARLSAALDRWWTETGGRDYAHYESDEFKGRGGELTISPRE